MAEYTNSNHERVDSLRSCLASPRQAIEQHIQKADSLHGLLKERFRTTMSQKRNTTVSMRQRLISLNPQRQLGIHLRNVSLLCTRLPASIQNLFQHRRERFHSNASLLESLSPLAVLHRGFSLNQKEDGSLLRSVEEVKQGDNVEIRLEDGKLKTRVLDKTKNLKS
jgi:exodeoxyribonuclease VII large subunit